MGPVGAEDHGRASVTIPIAPGLVLSCIPYIEDADGPHEIELWPADIRSGRSVVHLLEPVVAVIVTPIDEDGSVINARAMLAPTFKSHMGLGQGSYRRSLP